MTVPSKRTKRKTRKKAPVKKSKRPVKTRNFKKPKAKKSFLGKMVWGVLLGLILGVGGYVAAQFYPSQAKKIELTVVGKYKDLKENLSKFLPVKPTETGLVHKKHVEFDVPQINQLDFPRYENGCEVTSLAMLLNYRGINVTKSELAAKIAKVPYQYSNGQYGNPNVGFVGSIAGTDEPGFCVYHDPIYQLAKQYTKRVYDLTGSNFSTIIETLEEGNPVWTVTTLTFTPADDMRVWDTPQGKVNITYKDHSVVITGFDRQQKLIYVNDPMGYKNRAVSWQIFVKTYNQMGKQAIYVAQ